MGRRRNNSSLINIGGSSRGGRRGHKDTNDLISDGMKYASMFGVAQQGFKAWGQHNNNNNHEQRERSPAPPMMQQGTYYQAPSQYQQQPIQYREQIIQRSDDAAPPPYSGQPRAQPSANESNAAGHQTWCNGQCNGGCTRKLANTGEAEAYYHGDKLAES